MILSGLKKASVLPTQRTTPNWRLGILNHGDRLEMKGIQKSSVVLMYFLKLKVRSCVTGCAETRKVDGIEYTPRTLYLVLADIRYHIRKMDPSKSINLYLSSMHAIPCLSDYIPRALALRLKLQLFYQLQRKISYGKVEL